MSKILSIAVPCFNSEKFIQKTLNSFIETDIIDDIEIIVVNDGSKDQTLFMASSYSKKYPNTFIIIDKDNGGHGSVINIGIDIAKGKYFKVVDGDDWVDTSEFVKLIKYLKTSNSDLILSDYSTVSEMDFHKKRYIAENMECFKTYPINEVINKLWISIHSATFKTSVLRENSLKVSEKVFYEDMEYIIFPLAHVQTITYVDYNVYMYRIAQLSQSINPISMQKHIQDHYNVLFNLINFLNKYIQSDGEQEKIKYIANAIGIMINVHYEIYLSYPINDFARKKLLKQFDRKISYTCAIAYTESNKYLKVKLLRLMNFAGYTIFHFIYKIKVRKS